MVSPTILVATRPHRPARMRSAMTPRDLAATLLGAALVVVVSGCSSGSESVPAKSGSTSGVPIATTTTVPIDTTSTVTATSSTASSTSTTTTTVPIEDVRVTLVTVGDGFDNPVLLVAAPDGGPDLIVEQPGRIVRADNGAHEVVLNITDDVSFGGERGLLGLAIHPEFSTNALVYVNYIGRNGDTVVDQFELRGGLVDSATRREIIRIAQPAGNHNGGMLVFGPKGNLWIGMGDGGGRNDQFGSGQATDSLLGSLLRISVDGSGGGAYEIPPDNPYASGRDGRPEVWAVGLRNPWRFTIDDMAVWIADVGQGLVEEINVADANAPGLNYGWSVMEGSECFLSPTCDSEGLVLPIAEYSHGEGCSVTGGVVYRGSALPSLRGQFFYSDFCSGFLRSVSGFGDEHDWSDQVGEIPKPTGFGTGSDGEMYIVTQGGSLLRLEVEK